MDLTAGIAVALGRLELGKSWAEVGGIRRTGQQLLEVVFGRGFWWGKIVLDYGDGSGFGEEGGGPLCARVSPAHLPASVFIRQARRPSIS